MDSSFLLSFDLQLWTHLSLSPLNINVNYDKSFK